MLLLMVMILIMIGMMMVRMIKMVVNYTNNDPKYHFRCFV